MWRSSLDRFNGIAEVVEHVLYETFGLLVPGAVLVFGTAAATGLATLEWVLAASGDHPVLWLAGTYVVGYPLQGLSRPITNAAESALSLPGRLARRIPRVGSWFDSLESALGAGHRSVSDRPVAKESRRETADLKALAARYWADRLNLPAGSSLDGSQVVDLSFSAILAERRQLDRLRAATSLCRGTAAAVVIIASAIIIRIAVSPLSLTAESLAVVGLLAAVFYGLCERADMYAGLWRSVLAAQFLCTVTESASLSGEES